MGRTLYDSKKSEDTTIETELKTYLQNARQEGNLTHGCTKFSK
jgi:hypothetical protein